MDRPAWCTLLEKPAPRGDPRAIEEILRRNEDTVNRLTSFIKAVQIQRPQRQKKQLEGDRLHIDACIGATLDIRSGRVPDPRVHQRLARNSRDLAVLLLLDLSQSTNDWVPSAQSTVLNLAKEASVLVAHAMDKLGDKFAIHGFDSNGRHDVEYYRFKEFDEPYGEDARARLAGMKGQLSTRMGTALRHAGHFLRNRRSGPQAHPAADRRRTARYRRHDKRYLVLDTKRAVDDQRRHGIATFWHESDRKADEYVARIFETATISCSTSFAGCPRAARALPAANHLVTCAGYAPALRARMRGASKSFRIPPVPAARPFAPRRSTIRPVALFSLIAALLLDRARPLPSPNILWIWFRRYADRVARDLNAGQPIHGTAGWLAAVCPWVLAALVVFYLLYYVNPLLGWVWTVGNCIKNKRVGLNKR
jgi:hypothetical protein